ncbi:MAG: homoserine kinase [Candidatus Nanopelagicus sp.]|jgi:homoserine kinase|nr:homoserine kinase [Candidatus Nanopelagicus sp.]
MASKRSNSGLTFKATLAQISVPASSANIGPGFDCFGIALELRDRYAAQVLDDETFDVDVTGEGADEVKKDAKNLVIKSMLRGFEHMGAKPRGIALRALNVIPHGRGLGSSASAIVGGLALARSLVLTGEQYMSDEELITLATELEGHPDNVAAAFYGGATLAWSESKTSSVGDTKNIGRAVSLRVDDRIKALLLVPNNQLATAKARKLLPEIIPHQDAVLNSSRTALLVHALAERPDLLFIATEDLLHQKYRAQAMPKTIALVEKLRGAGLAAVVSGAGPSVMVLYSGAEDEIDQLESVSPGFTAMKLAIAKTGAQ